MPPNHHTPRVSRKRRHSPSADGSVTALTGSLRPNGSSTPPSPHAPHVHHPPPYNNPPPIPPHPLIPPLIPLQPQFHSPSIPTLRPINPSTTMYSSSLPYDQMHPYNLSRSMPLPLPMDRHWKPNIELAPNCPRCDSSNTKFCYYNNYSLTQPRYFCKGCRRYWTKGGSLRNVPVGGGCRKNRRTKSVRPSTGPTARPTDHHAMRPDLALDDMAQSVSTKSNSIGATSASDGSAIDLAVLYAKFLNNQQCPGTDQGGVGVPELGAGHDDQSFVWMGSSGSDQVGFNSEGSAEFVGEFNYSFDPSGYNEELAIPAVDKVVVDDVFQMNSGIFPNVAWQPHCPVPEIGDAMIMSGDNWSSFDQSNFGGF